MSRISLCCCRWISIAVLLVTWSAALAQETTVVADVRDAQTQAPEVVAKGRNRVALRILETARAHRVPVVEDPPLARLLHRTCDVGRKIPENLYQAVAEVLAFVYRLDPRRGSTWGAGT